MDELIDYVGEMLGRILFPVWANKGAGGPTSGQAVIGSVGRWLHRFITPCERL